MTEQTPPLAERIDALDDATAIEAAQMLAAAMDAAPVSTEGRGELLERPLEHLDDLGILCRVFLQAAATDPDLRGLVDESIDGAGRKQLVLGGAELVALAVLVVGGLQICLSRGRTAEEEEITLSTGEDGRQQVVVRRSVRYGISANLGKLLGSVFPK